MVRTYLGRQSAKRKAPIFSFVFIIIIYLAINGVAFSDEANIELNIFSFFFFNFSKFVKIYPYLILLLIFFILTFGVIAVACSKSGNNCSQADIFRTKFSNQTLSQLKVTVMNFLYYTRWRNCASVCFSSHLNGRGSTAILFFFSLTSEDMKQMGYLKRRAKCREQRREI